MAASGGPRSRATRSSGTASGEPFVRYNPETDNSALIGLLDKHGVKIRPPPSGSRS